MKLQLALDVFNLEDALSLAAKVQDCVDIIEVGTPFLLEYGIEAVRRLKGAFPNKEILADTKIMDAGEFEASAAFEAGADYVTVLALTDCETMRACVNTAERCAKKVVADMICVEDTPGKVAELESLCVHGLAVHVGIDQQQRGITPLDGLKLLRECSRRSAIFVAGGITLDTLEQYARLSPDVLIVGGAIGDAGDPAMEARRFYEKIRALNIKPK